MSLRSLVERAVTKQDYFHQLHAAEQDIAHPTQSYYYDLRARASYPGAFEGALPIVDYGGLRFANPIHASQFGIAHIQHYWDSADAAWLERATAVAHGLVAAGKVEGSSLVWRYPLEIRATRDWLSSMAQGQAASFLLRAATLTGDSTLMDAARGALAPFFLDVAKGGVQATLQGNVWLEEYAFEPLPFTLNGYIVSLFGLYDATHLLEPQDESYQRLLEKGLMTLERVLPLFDAKGWSRYDLSRRTRAGLSVRNLASPFYHRFHVELLDIMARLTGKSIYSDFRAKWARSLTEGATFYTATAEKIAYRALAGAPFSSASTGTRSTTDPISVTK